MRWRRQKTEEEEEGEEDEKEVEDAVSISNLPHALPVNS